MRAGERIHLIGIAGSGAAGVALLRTLRPYAGVTGPAAVGLEVAPFLLALVYLVLFSRRSLRMAATRQARLDPDTL